MKRSIAPGWSQEGFGRGEERAVTGLESCPESDTSTKPGPNGEGDRVKEAPKAKSEWGTTHASHIISAAATVSTEQAGEPQGQTRPSLEGCRASAGAVQEQDQRSHRTAGARGEGTPSPNTSGDRAGT